MAENSILELDTTQKTEYMVIDGVRHYLTQFDDFSPKDQMALAKKGARIQDLAKRLGTGEITDEEINEVGEITDEMFNKIAGEIPEDVKAVLKPGHKQKISNAYFLALGARAGDMKKEVSESGSPTLSPSSKDSTVEESPTGSNSQPG